MLAFVTKLKSSSQIKAVEDPKPKQGEAPPAKLSVLFDPLAEQLHLTPAQQTFDVSLTQPAQTHFGSLIQ
jgi:hypothetical protein